MTYDFKMRNVFTRATRKQYFFLPISEYPATARKALYWARACPTKL